MKFNLKESVLSIEEIFNRFEFEMLKYKLNRMIKPNLAKDEIIVDTNEVKQDKLF